MYARFDRVRDYCFGEYLVGLYTHRFSCTTRQQTKVIASHIAEVYNAKLSSAPQRILDVIQNLKNSLSLCTYFDDKQGPSQPANRNKRRRGETKKSAPFSRNALIASFFPRRAFFDKPSDIRGSRERGMRCFGSGRPL